MSYAIYARKSTESEDRQVQSLDDQLAALHSVASRENISVSHTLTEAKSAKAPGERPEFEKLMKLVESGKISGILTWSINRLTRNPVDGGRIAYLLQTGNLECIRTPERKYVPEDNAILLAVETGVATSYIQDLRRNVIRGMDSRARRGWCCSKAPLGYRNNAETRGIDIHPVNFPIVRRLFELAATGNYTLAQLQREAANLGLAPYRKGAKGTVVSKGVISNMLANPFYMGQFEYKGELIQGKHKPVVDSYLFGKVREAMSTGFDIRRLDEPFAFAGTLKCTTCGCAVIGSKKVRTLNDGTVREHVYYHCSGAKGCSRKSISEAKLMQLFQNTMESYAVEPSTADWIARAYSLSVEADSALFAQSASHHEQEHRKLTTKLKKLHDLRLEGELDKAEYAEMKASIQTEITMAEQARAKSSSILDTMMRTLTESLELSKQAFASPGETPLHMVKTALRSAFDSLEFRDGIVGFRLNPILAKIATFEPLRNGSQSPKSADLKDPRSVWWGLIQDIRTVSGSNSAKFETPTCQARTRSA